MKGTAFLTLLCNNVTYCTQPVNVESVVALQFAKLMQLRNGDMPWRCLAVLGLSINLGEEGLHTDVKGDNVSSST